MKKKTVIIATIKSWNIENAKKFKKQYLSHLNTILITHQNQLDASILHELNPSYIFFPHWSWIIPETIFKNHACVIFHMTDLPYGRGGSPLQNLIVRRIKKTKITALKAVRELDAGPVYMKKDLDLRGSATQIYKRASKIIFNKMIPEIIKKNPTPVTQKGKPVFFHRRKPYQSRIANLKTLDEIYDHIRMLDAEGYPKAYIENKKVKIYFENAKLRNGILTAKAFMEINQ
ncbi:MAG: methionyl-tRNA formyltransferase [Candidatus Aureabacteria bacterium]|nr:methionyl-tRNA formyltransferase [Candidatus Auribacterota bacterium]